MSIVRVHHLNCGTLCPVAAGMVTGTGDRWSRGRWPCHCFLVDTGAGLVLVDTGLGTADCAHPERFPWVWRQLTKPAFDPAESAIAQVRALGLDPRDVRDIVVTHLDLDHAGGISDFPWARVHVHAAEYAVATVTSRVDQRVRGRYLAEHWTHEPRWELYADAGDDWFGFAAVRQLRGLGADLALVPLAGHTRGHSGVAVRTGDRWLLHAGDAFFAAASLDRPDAEPVGARAFQRANSFDDRLRRANLARLARLHATRANEVTIVCAHDPVALDRCQAAATRDAGTARAPISGWA